MAGARGASTFSLSSVQPPVRFQAERRDMEFVAGVEKRLPYRFSVVAWHHHQETKAVASNHAADVCNGSVGRGQVKIERGELAQQGPCVGAGNQETRVGRKRFVDVGQVADANTRANGASFLFRGGIALWNIPAVLFGHGRAGFFMPSM